MPTLTDEQRSAFRKQVDKLYPNNRCEELNADGSLRSWWRAREEDIYSAMRKIDCDQMSSAASLPTIWACIV